MKAFKYILYVLWIGTVFSSCNKDEFVPYDNPFFYIHFQNSSEVNIASNRNETVNYKVYFSTKRQFEPVTLNYTIVTGNGLQEGVDFEIINTTRSLVFAPGIIEMPVTIRWISNPIDINKDNSLTIKLLDNDKNITVGLPGPDKLQAQLKFIKN